MPDDQVPPDTPVRRFTIVQRVSPRRLWRRFKFRLLQSLTRSMLRDQAEVMRRQAEAAPRTEELQGGWRMAKGPGTVSPLIVQLPDGTNQLFHSGMSVKFGAAGAIAADFGPITRVGIDNIIDLQSYGLDHRDGRTMHLMEFRNGACCELTYTAAGSVEVFRTSGHMTIERSVDGSVVLRQPPIAPLLVIPRPE